MWRWCTHSFIFVLAALVLSTGRAYAQFAEEFYRLAEVRHQVQDFSGAIALCDEAIARRTTYVDALYLRGSSKLALGDALSALPDFDRAIKLSRYKDKAYAGRSSAHNYLGNYTQAIEDADRALALDSSLTGALLSKANALIGQKQYSQAIVWCNRALRQDSLNAGARISRADALFALGKIELSRQEYARVIFRSPSSASEFEINGQARSKLGDYPGARADYTQALNYSRQMVDSRLGRAVIALQLNEPKAAVEDLNLVLRLNPRHLTALVVRGDAYRQLNQADLAMDDYHLALSLDPSYAFAYFARANAHYDKGNYTAALSDYNDALARNDDDFAAYNNRGNLFSRLRQYDRALADYRRAAKINPTDPDMHYNTALAHYHVGRRDSASAHLKLALLSNPQHRVSLVMEAEMAYERGDYAVTLSAISRLPAEVQQAPNLLVLKGQALEQRCDYPPALEAYAQALLLEPNNPEALLGQGNIYFDQHQDSLAAISLERVMALQPHRTDVMWNLIIVLKRLHRTEDALHRCTEALDQAPSAIEFLTERGLLHFGLQQFDRACEDWRNAASRGDSRAQDYLKSTCS